MKIAQVGTFDLDNLGDLLFPWITSRLIRSLLPLESDLEYRLYCPTDMGSMIYADQLPYRAISALDRDDVESDYNLILIGGGDLVRDDDYSLYSTYGSTSPELTFSHILSPTVSDRRRLASLAVGLPYDADAEFAAYLANSFKRMISASVRDQRSAAKLHHAVPGIKSQIVPDFVHALPVFLDVEECARHVRGMLPSHSSGYLCFQGHADVCDEPSAVANILKEIEKNVGKPFVLVEIGGCLGDTEYLQRLGELTGYLVVDKETFPNITMEEKVSVIACSHGFIGSSLHGNIISNSYGINNISYVGKFSHKIREYFSEPGNGVLFEDFGHCSSALSEVVDILLRPAGHPLDVDSIKFRTIVDFLGDLLNTSTAELTSFSSSLDNLYKKSHAKFCSREYIVRQQLNALESSLAAEKANAVAQITYRQTMIEQLDEQLAKEKDNARQQIQYRDALVAELEGLILQEKENARQQIEYRDALVGVLEKLVIKEKENASEQIAARDRIIDELKKGSGGI